MSLDDFDRLLPSEFNAILECWRREQSQRESRTLAALRLHAAITVQPHCKKPVRPAELFEIPEIDRLPESVPEMKLTREERRRRFEELKKARGYE